jgi:3-deoxy-D-manno-octulosonic-acid transferase
MYVLYSAALALALMVSSPYWLVQMLRRGKYRAGLAERLGRVPARLRRSAAPGCIWVHAVSVGEVLAMAGVVREIHQRLPNRRVVVSTTTAAGQKLARERFGEANVFYFPFDFAFAIRPYLRLLRPDLAVVAETEFWPNFLRLLWETGAPVLVANARISDRSFPRYRAVRQLTRRVLANVTRFLAQSEEDKRRLIGIGAAPERVEVGGNLKFDISLPTPPLVVARLRSAFSAGKAGPILVAGSTVEGEEAQVLKAFRAVLGEFPAAVLILAPRHPERFESVGEQLARSELKFWRRSQWRDEAVAGGVFLLDSIGELASIYALADVAFIGGSLVPRGGHNIMEAAVQGVATLVGPHTENFRDIVARFRQADAVRAVLPQDLRAALLYLLKNDAERQSLGQRAAELVGRNLGATARTADEIERLLRSLSSGEAGFLRPRVAGPAGGKRP